MGQLSTETGPSHQIRENLLTSETLHIECTVCLGLGCMEDIVYLGSEYATWRTNLTALPKSEVTSHAAESKRILEIAFSNRSLFQLILFETALLILEEKFKLPQVVSRIQDSLKQTWTSSKDGDTKCYRTQSLEMGKV
jgi:hypothetical protein